MPGGFGVRAGAFIPGAGQMTDYKADFLLGAYYGDESFTLKGWSWEVGLDITSPESADGTEEVHLMLFRGDVRTNLYEWVLADLGLYLFWGGELAVPTSSNSETSFLLTSGAGLRSERQRWDFRFTGQGVLGDGNTGIMWVVTIGYLF